MKKVIVLLCVSIAIALQANSKSLTIANSFEINANYGGIQDGWYEAVVKYSNYSTGTDATYTLKVKVEFGNISKIDFGNGGSVHSGYNNEGYIYSGGYLIFEKDFNGNTIAATATVTVSDSDGIRYYKIRIE